MTQAISTGSPQAAFVPLIFSLYTNSCTSSHKTIKLVKFAVETILFGLISGTNKSADRWELNHLVMWCSKNNLELNTKTEEMVVDLKRSIALPTTVILCDSLVASFESFCFLDSIITQDLM